MTNESLESDYESASQWTPPGSVQIWGLLMATAGFAVMICDPHSWTWGLVLLSLSFAMVPSAGEPMPPCCVMAHLYISRSIAELVRDERLFV
eukprot:55910-Eustigmatos_ZCMA.PRE.1